MMDFRALTQHEKMLTEQIRKINSLIKKNIFEGINYIFIIKYFSMKFIISLFIK